MGLWCLKPLSTILRLSWQSVLLVKVTGENHRLVASLWQTFSHNVVSPWTGFELTSLVVIGTDCTGSCKSNYHAITTTTASSGKDTLHTLIMYLMYVVVVESIVRWKWYPRNITDLQQVTYKVNLIKNRCLLDCFSFTYWP